MSVYFFDSSALAKRYLQEPGSSWVQAITAPSAGHRIYVSVVARVEVVSAVARLVREGKLTHQVAAALEALVNQEVGRDFGAIDVVDTVIRQAQGLLHQYPLRSLDAIQLAAGLTVYQRVMSGQVPFTFVAGDTRLLQAAQQVGLPTDDPNRYP